MAESEEELKSLLMKVKVESEKVGLKFNIQILKIMASGPITSWEIDREIVETVSDSIFGGSKITADGDCSHEIKKRLLLGRKIMINLEGWGGEGDWREVQKGGGIRRPMASLVAQMVKHLSTMRETRVLCLGWEDPLEKEMAIHSRTIAWKIPGTEEPGRLQPMGSQRVGHD